MTGLAQAIAVVLMLLVGVAVLRLMDAVREDDRRAWTRVVVTGTAALGVVAVTALLAP